MIAFNIFKWIGELFTEVLFSPFEWLRLTIATADKAGGFQMLLIGDF
jgi:hypothetical protein